LNVVYDTMVFLQNASRPDRTHASWQAVRDRRVILCLSGELVAEVQDVLTRDEIRRRFPGLTPLVAQAFIGEMLTLGTLFDPVSQAFTWPHHADDDYLFNLAIAAGAERIVTSETRLLTMGNHFPLDAERLGALAPQLRVVTPKDFSVELRAARPDAAG
jgi:putative PIN family toxin of toxin-antitoxin system